MRHIDHFLPFSWVITHDLCSQEDFDSLTPRCTTIEASAKCVISTIFGRFRGLGRISMPCDPRYTTIEASAKCVISTIFCSSGPGPAPAGALHGPQPPPGHIHRLHQGLLHRLQRGDLLHVGPMGCRGTACSTRGLSTGRRGTAAACLEHLLSSFCTELHSSCFIFSLS